jgi:hypothetical protein
VSGVLSLAKPQRIKASHRRRWKGTTGHRLYIMNNPLSGTDPTGYVSTRDPDEAEPAPKITREAPTGSHIKSNVTTTGSDGSSSTVNNFGHVIRRTTVSNGSNGQSVVGYRSANTKMKEADFKPTQNEIDNAGKYKFNHLKTPSDFSTWRIENKIVAMYADMAIGEAFMRTMELALYAKDNEVKAKANRIISAFNSMADKVELNYALNVAGEPTIAAVSWPGIDGQSGAITNPGAPAFNVSMISMRDAYANGVPADKKYGYRFNISKGYRGLVDLMGHELGHFDIQSMVNMNTGEPLKTMENKADSWLWFVRNYKTQMEKK